MSEAEIVAILLTRRGKPTRVVTVDREPMLIVQVEQVAGALLVPTDEQYRYARAGGIALSAKGKYDYFFYSNEVAEIQDAVSGATLFVR